MEMALVFPGGAKVDPQFGFYAVSTESPRSRRREFGTNPI
jgi:hypothetical protein